MLLPQNNTHDEEVERRCEVACSPLCDPRQNSERLVACFGSAQLVRNGHGRLEVRSGADSDRADARRWVGRFLHRKDVRQLNSCFQVQAHNAVAETATQIMARPT